MKMKEKYIKQVSKNLHISNKAKNEIVRDLGEIFDSAIENGETEQRVIDRLGDPKEFAESVSGQENNKGCCTSNIRGIISMAVGICIAVILSITLAGCSNKESGINPDINSTDSIVTFNEDIWPENEYTDGLPVPPGMVSRALLDKTKKNCAVFLVDLTDEEYDTYIEILKQQGFSEVEKVSEGVKGQDYTSTGTILSNNEKTLSISYIPGNLGIYISFDTIPSV